jgi:hypothetical protein
MVKFRTEGKICTANEIRFSKFNEIKTWLADKNEKRPRKIILIRKETNEERIRRRITNKISHAEI